MLQWCLLQITLCFLPSNFPTVSIPAWSGKIKEAEGEGERGIKKAIPSTLKIHENLSFTFSQSLNDRSAPALRGFCSTCAGTAVRMPNRLCEDGCRCVILGKGGRLLIIFHNLFVICSQWDDFATTQCGVCTPHYESLEEANVPLGTSSASPRGKRQTSKEEQKGRALLN